MFEQGLLRKNFKHLLFIFKFFDEKTFQVICLVQIASVTLLEIIRADCNFILRDVDVLGGCVKFWVAYDDMFLVRVS